MSTPAQIITVLAAVAVAAAATWRVLRRRTDARQRATLLAAAHAACRDPLTGSGSRFAFHETMATAISQRRRAAVILVNLDGSRPFVSRFGDRAVDQLLVLIAGRVQHLAAAAGGSSFRLRRDELVAIVDGPVTDATPLAAQFLAAVAEPIEMNLVGHPLTVTVSACAGVTAFTVNSADDARLALVRSDTAMRSAKQAGRGQVAVFEPASVRRRGGASPSAPTDGSAGGWVAR
jgi:diguanylate cyclase (GGDEF)-like protein